MQAMLRGAQNQGADDADQHQQIRVQLGVGEASLR